MTSISHFRIHPLNIFITTTNQPTISTSRRERTQHRSSSSTLTAPLEVNKIKIFITIILNMICLFIFTVCSLQIWSSPLNVFFVFREHATVWLTHISCSLCCEWKSGSENVVVSQRKKIHLRKFSSTTDHPLVDSDQATSYVMCTRIKFVCILFLLCEIERRTDVNEGGTWNMWENWVKTSEIPKFLFSWSHWRYGRHWSFNFDIFGFHVRHRRLIKRKNFAPARLTQLSPDVERRKL